MIKMDNDRYEWRRAGQGRAKGMDVEEGCRSVGVLRDINQTS
jgi:hypothetical protein